MKKYRVNKVDHEVSDEKFNYNTTAELNPDATLREIKEKVGSTKKYRRAPGPRYLRCCEDIVAAATESDFRMEVYSNGFAIYQTPGHANVLRMEDVGRAKYPDDPSVEIFDQNIDLDDMAWTVAVMSCGDERVDERAHCCDADILVSLSYFERSNDDNEFNGVEIDAGINIEEEYIQREERREFLDTLKQREYKCFEMYYVQGLERKEIAKALGITRQYVGTILTGIKTKAKEFYENFE